MKQATNRLREIWPKTPRSRGSGTEAGPPRGDVSATAGVAFNVTDIQDPSLPLRPRSGVREPLGHVVELVDEVVRWAPGTVGDAEDQPAGVAEDPRR